MKPTNREVISWVLAFWSVPILGLVLAVASGVLDNPLDRPPKVTPPQVVQVECFSGAGSRSIFIFFWTDGTQTDQQNGFSCPQSMYVPQRDYGP